MLKKQFKKLGFKNDEIDNIRNTYPINQLTDETLIEKLNDLFDYLILFGYKKHEARKIINQCPSILGYEIDTLNEKLNKDFIKIGYDKKQVKKIVKSFPKIVGYDNNKILDKIDHLESLDYSRKQIIKMTTFSPSILGEDESSIDDKIKFLFDFGFSKEQIIKMTFRLSSILTYSISSINEKLIFFVELGYTKEQICKMVVEHPQLLSYKSEVNKRKYDALISEEFSDEEALMLFYNMPSLFSGDFSRHLGKIRFLREIGLENVIFETPKNLIQSIELTYARYNFLKSIGEEVSSLDFSRLFYDNDRFAKKFNKTREQLIEMYSYDDYLNERESKNGYTL